jgi:hypothetical protein
LLLSLAALPQTTRVSVSLPVIATFVCSQVFDFKLRHMRDDIAAIEASNNSLERQARHNTALMRLLEQLLGGLGVKRSLAAALEAPDLKLDR